MAQSIIFGALLYKIVFRVVVCCCRTKNNEDFPER